MELLNKTDKKIPELLAPAGSPEAFDAAIKAGADAVYFGTTLFNARMNARNITRDNVRALVEKAHENGVRTHVTLNTAITDRQLGDAVRLAEFLYKSQVDALIVADLGLASQIHKYFPDFELHASTQASGHNLGAAKFMKEQGFSRMVAARELSADDLRYLCANSPIEIEAFVHGALCVCASGQCLFSSLVGGRSGNRGECAQPCRLPYNNKYPLSLKDNCLASHITELIDMGVSSLKIEGRMKSPEYVRSVVEIYRALLDENRNADRQEIEKMAKVFSRSGFTDGYFTKNLGASMLGVRSEADKNATNNAKYVENKTKSSKFAPKAPIDERVRENMLPDGYKAPIGSKREPKASVSARFYDPRSLDNDVARLVDIAYFPLDAFDKIPMDKVAGGCELGALLPPVIPDSEMAAVKSKLERAKKMGVTHLMVGNVGHIELAKETGLTLHGDFRLNVFSNATAILLSAYFEDIITAPELTLAQIRDIKIEKSVCVYGKVPLMVLENPVGTGTLTDRRGATFFVKSEGGRDIIFNSVPFYMGDKKADLEKAFIKNKHFIFVTEGPREARFMLENYQKNLPTRKDFRRFPT
jgi:collagenase-like PrtC family protease